MDLFFMFLVVLGIVTVVGHVIWVILASLFRVFVDQKKPSQPGSNNFSAFCPDCEGVKLFRDKRCVVCNIGIDELTNRHTQTSISKLKQVRRSLENLYRQKHISREQLERMVDSILLEKIAEKTIDREPAIDIVEFAGAESPQAAPPALQPEPIPVAPVPTKRETKQKPLAVRTEPIPRKTFGDLMQSFMEEKNIRWGELVSGMLIVGSAIGLVTSLWSKLENTIPFFPALIFLSVTLAIHAAGLYTLKKWKLQSTSRGLLIISTLLVPLNFLAAIALNDRDDDVGTYYWLAVSIGLFAYSYVAASTKRILFETETDSRQPLISSLFASLAHPFVLILIGPCIGQLLISRHADPQSSLGTLTLLSMVPFLSFFVGVCLQIHRFYNDNDVSEKQIDRTLTVLGVAFFSLMLTVGLLAFKTQSIAITLAKISPALGLAGMAVMSAGLLVHRKAIAETLISRRIVGTSLLLIGWAFIAWTLFLAWPVPLLLVILGGLYFVGLLAASLVFRLPFLSMPAVLSLGFTILIAFHALVLHNISLSFETDPTLLQLFFWGESSLITMIEAAIAMMIAFGLLRKSREKLLSLKRIDEISLEWFDYPQCLVVSSLFLSFVSMTVAVYAGFISGDDGVSYTTPVFLVASIVTLAACFSLHRKFHFSLSSIGSLLFFIFLWHLLSRNDWMEDFLIKSEWIILHPFALATLIHATFAVGLSIVFQKLGFAAAEDKERAQSKNAVTAMLYSALASSSVALFVFLFMDFEWQHVFAIYAFWIMTIWLVISKMMKLPVLWNGAQVLSAAGLVLAVTAYCRSREWWNADFNTIYFFQVLIGVSALLAILWAFTKKQLVANLSAFDYLKKAVSVEMMFWGISLLGAFGIFGMGCLAGIRHELIPVGPPQFRGIAFGQYEILAVGILSLLNLLVVLLFFSRRPMQSVTLNQSIAPSERKTFLSSSDLWSLLLTCVMVGVTILAVTSLDSLAGLSEAAAGEEFYRALFGRTGWILLGILIANSSLYFWLEQNSVTKYGLVAVLALLPTLVAGQFVESNLTASTLRWSFAIFGLVFGLLNLIEIPVVRTKLQEIFPDVFENSRLKILDFSRCGTIFAFVPVILLSFYTAIVAFRFHGLPTISGDSFFHDLKSGYSYSIPIFLLAATSLIFWNRRELLHKYETAVFLVATGICYQILMSQLLSPDSPAFDLETWVNLLQIEGVTLAILALLGLVVFVALEEHLVKENHADSFEVLHYAALVLNICLGSWATFQIVLDPVSPHDVVKILGNSWAFTGLAVATISAFSYSFLARNQVFRDLGIISLFSLAAWPAAAFFERNLDSAWFSYHALIVGWLSLNLVFCLGFFATKFWKSSEYSQTTIAEREQWNHRLQNYLTAGTALVMLLVMSDFLRSRDHLSLLVWVVAVSAMVVASVGVVLRNPFWAYSSSFLAVLAGIFCGIDPWMGLSTPPTAQQWLTLVELIVFAAGMASIFWIVIEVFFQKRFQTSWNLNANAMPVHHAYSCVGLVLISLCIVFTMFCHLVFSSELISRNEIAIPELATRWGWLALGILGCAFISSLWDRTAKHALPSIAILLLAIGFTSLERYDFTQHQLWVWSAWILTAQVLIAGSLWMSRQPLKRFAESIFVPTENLDDKQLSSWLPGMNLVLVTLVLCAGFGLVVLLPDRPLRIWAAFASLLSVLGLSQFSGEKWIKRIQLLILALLPLAFTQLVWASMDLESHSKIWLVRSIHLMEVFAASTLIYAGILNSPQARKASWGSSLNSVLGPVGIATVAVLLTVLGQELYWFLRSGNTEIITNMQVAVVAVALIGFIVALISMAISPQRDPLNLSDRGKHFYVYTAEVVAALLFLHIYLTKPEFFSGYFREYWPFIVLAIAFFGAAVGELFHRRKMFVLSEPLHRTGAFLPLIPALAFWTVEAKPQYQTVLFFAGLIYAMLSFWRKSFVYSVLAALAGNAALWALWSQQGFDISLQPQLWLIPPAISVLIATQLNHRRLTPAQLSSIRYPALMTIYLSSTGDMFLAGIDEGLKKPVILSSLSILGIFAGIFLRIRSFLYLGTSFLMLSIVSMVWYSASQTGEFWPWWVFGIVSGLAILTIFGLFEKKRDEMRLVIDKMKHWEA